MKNAIEFITAAARSGVYLYRELATSAFQLVPALTSELRSRSHPLSRVRDSLASLPSGSPSGMSLQSRSPQTL